VRVCFFVSKRIQGVKRDPRFRIPRAERESTPLSSRVDILYSIRKLYGLTRVHGV
jgi:hypothetical protein